MSKRNRVSAFTPDRIKRLQRYMHVDDTNFGASVGVDRRTISRWKSGTSEPSTLAEMRLSDIERKMNVPSSTE